MTSEQSMSAPGRLPTESATDPERKLEGNRAFISLQLLDAKSRGTVWSENYDYRGIDANMIIPDIIKTVLKRTV
jgi:hypothetical protein